MAEYINGEGEESEESDSSSLSCLEKGKQY